MLVAIYGTLKVGYANYERHLKGATPRSAGFVELPYEMFTGPEYPMLVPTAKGERHRIWVEIFDVTDDKMNELDALEEPYGYGRETIYVEELGESVAIYVHPTPAPGGFNPLPSGKWPEST